MTPTFKAGYFTAQGNVFIWIFARGMGNAIHRVKQEISQIQQNIAEANPDKAEWMLGQRLNYEQFLLRHEAPHSKMDEAESTVLNLAEPEK